MKTLVIVSGYFNPLHKGHVEYLQQAKALGDYLVVIVNNDKQRELKGAKEFMKQDERMMIISALRCVDEVVLCVDEDVSVSRTLKIIKPNIFAKGGDRYSSEIPESKICNELGIKIIDGLGAKIQSSSWLLDQKL